MGAPTVFDKQFTCLDSTPEHSSEGFFPACPSAGMQSRVERSAQGKQQKHCASSQACRAGDGGCTSSVCLSQRPPPSSWVAGSSAGCRPLAVGDSCNL